MEHALSCGIVLMNEHDELFLAHTTASSHWDIPKGTADEGETPLQAALRETAEESGLVIQAGHVLDLGSFTYRSDKTLHLFAAKVRREGVDLAKCQCRSFFIHPLSSRELPEVDEFGWIPFQAIPAYCAKNMTRVLTRSLNLSELASKLPLHTRLEALSE